MTAGTRTTFRFESGVKRTFEARQDDRSNADAAVRSARQTKLFLPVGQANRGGSVWDQRC